MSMMYRKGMLIITSLSLLVLCLLGGIWVYGWLSPSLQRSHRLLLYLRNPQAYSDWRIAIGQRCGTAPFLFPTAGYIGYLWGDSFRLGHHHQGIDIFGGEVIGKTEVRAAYAGYLTRLPDWKSSLIIRIPQDPLHPYRQIWTYYTHMADPDGNSFIVADFPAGTNEVFVTAGTLLGYQGNYSGNPKNPTGVHLHFSIVKDHQGKFLNELEFGNTLDPSPYFGLPLNGSINRDQLPICLSN